jgi:hypothetical protein
MDTLYLATNEGLRIAHRESNGWGVTLGDLK